MQKVFFQLILRRIRRNKLYSIINVAGLSIALTASLLIYSHIVKELKTDRFHQNGENIYRVNLSGIFNTAWSSVTCDGLGPALKNEIPGVEYYTRLERSKYLIKTPEATDYIQPDHCIFTDNHFFRMFTFPLVSGNIPDETKENWCIISEKYARFCFGNENPAGKLLTVKADDYSGKTEEVRIAGVMKNIPDCSSIQADVVFNYRTKAAVKYPWDNYNAETYVQLTSQTDPQFITAAVKDLFKKHRPLNAEKIQGHLQPLQDIYFGSADIQISNRWGYIPHGSRLLTLILGLVTFIIFLLAACNYMLIKMANLNQDFPQLAIQKCYGAGTRSLQMQFITELVLQILTALLISGMAVKILHPYFVGIMSPQQPYPLHVTLTEAGLFLLYVVFLISIAGISLYLYLQKHLTTRNIKDITLKQTGRYDLKKVLAVTQMCIFCTLLFVSAVILKQMHYLENKDLGLNTENTLWVQIQDNDSENLKNEVLQNPKIFSISNSEAIPIESNINQIKFTLPDDPEKLSECNVLVGDCEFLSVFKIPLFEGTNIDPESFRKNNEIQSLFYQKKYEAEQQGKKFAENFPYVEHQILVNRKFVKTHHLQQPIGTVLTYKIANFTKYFRIVGVTEDFHYQPLYKEIEPVLICYNAGFNLPGSFNIRYQEGARQEVLAFLKSLNEKQLYYSNHLIYSEYRYSDIYDKDIAFIRMINIFTLMALLIGGMGIFAFSVFLAANKKKEIALRKVNGATEWEVVSLLNNHFLKRILLACTIGFPTGYFLIQKWLENFAYKTSLDWWLFIGVIFICISFVLLVISFQTWKSATLNPVKSLQRE